ncbi:MAG: substrate-binding domain-containing protein [Muribaculaceae bacterium]|nr:substrate-binding domain-containing protein [Muribaculaceae bacterium]
MKRQKLTAIAAMLLIVGGILAGCTSKGGRKEAPKGNSATSGTLVMSCDASFENIMQEEIEVFEFCYPYASVLADYTDEKAAIDSVVLGNARVAVVSRELTKDQLQYLKERKRVAKTKKIAVDAIAVIVNPENPIENLSIKELREILTGSVTRWDELCPTKLGSIQVIFDHSGSSIVKYMSDSLMNGQKFPANVYSANTIPAVFEAVKNRPNAIGLVGVSWISTDLKTADMSTEEKFKTLEADDTTTTEFTTEVKVLPIRRDNSLVAVKPYQAYIFDGSYPLFRSIYMINTGAAGSLANGFFSFVTSFQGQKLIQTTGVLPALVSHRQVEVTD